MKNLSLKLEKDIFEESEKILKKMDKTRNRYFNEAIDFYNKLQNRRMLQNRLKNESYLTREESLSVLKEFDSIENGDKTI